MGQNIYAAPRRAMFLGRSLEWYREGEPVGLFASIIGAIVLLALFNAWWWPAVRYRC